jgi:exo-beta-1,3-glucanase (GH17 family)
MSKIKFCLSFFLLVAIFSNTRSQSNAPSHEIFDRLLKKHVSPDGKVNYKGFAKDSAQLNIYLTLLSKNPPNEKSWNKNEQMAYWINAYNAFTIQLILRYYPIKSIKDIGTRIQIPFVNTPWDIKFILIGNEKLDLNNIEHSKLRKQFDDARIHMVLVCASKSCPILINEAYDAHRLDTQLNKQTVAFLSDTYRNKVAPEKPQLNMIFDWYSMDFSKNVGSVRDFVNKHSAIKIKAGAKISFIDYDWGLNE